MTILKAIHGRSWVRCYVWRVLGVLLGICWLGFSGAGAQVVINEIHYHPVEEPAFDANGDPVLDLTEDVHEFIELHNAGPAMVDLSGWSFSRGVKFVFPAQTFLPAGGYVVVARDAVRLGQVPEYAPLSASVLVGSWSGKLRNSGETIQLRNAALELVDEVDYRPGFPWPEGADALGAGKEWIGIDPITQQYRGRSLERISPFLSGNSPANWRAAPLPEGPTPGRENHAVSLYPHPVVHFLEVNSGQLVAPNIAAEVTCAFTAGEVKAVTLEYFIDELGVENENVVSLPMTQEINGERVTYSASIPGQAQGAVVRYRVRANDGAITSPRPDDVRTWYGYSPVLPAGATPLYSVQITLDAVDELRNIVSTYQPFPAPANGDYGPSRADGWNATVPAVFLANGEVRDVAIRFQGSLFSRSQAVAGIIQKSYKVKFPRYDRFQGQRSILLTNKGVENQDAHALFRELDFPISETQSVSVQFNTQLPRPMLELRDMNKEMLEDYYQRLVDRGTIAEEPEQLGHLIEASGIFQDSGPWGRADGIPLQDNGSYLARDRYPWTYSIKLDDWRGYSDFVEMLEAHAVLGFPDNNPSAEQITAMRAFLNERWDVARALDYYAVAEWMRIWDDQVHNYFYYLTPAGKWTVLPWDFDDTFEDKGLLVHDFGPSFRLAFADEYKARLHALNHTELSQAVLETYGLTRVASSYAATRSAEIDLLTGLGSFLKPAAPTLSIPADGSLHLPDRPLVTEPFSHPENGATHASTLWEIRAAKGDYQSPVYRVQSATALTSLTVPSDTLRLGQTYFWRTRFFDQQGRPSDYSAEFAFTAGLLTTPPPDLRLSEIAANNSSSVQHDGRFLPWVELHNSGSSTVSLEGFVLRRHSGASAFTFPAGTSLAADEFLTVWLAAPLPGSTGLYTGFTVSEVGGTLWLQDADGTDLDALSFGLQADGFTLGRVAQEWTLCLPTPGASNTGTMTSAPTDLSITEWLAAPSSGPDWLELTNHSDQVVELTGLTLEDRSGERTTFPPRSFIGPDASVQLFADNTPALGAHHLDFALSDATERLILRDSTGTILDQVSFWNQENDVSQGRYPASSAIGSFSNPTPGARNPTNPDADNDQLPDDWESANNVSDPNADPDQDGFTNLEEYLAFTDPRDSADKLQATIVSLENGTLEVNFTAKADRLYLLEASAQLRDPWMIIQAFQPQPADVTASFSLSRETIGFFRLRVRLP